VALRDARGSIRQIERKQAEITAVRCERDEWKEQAKKRPAWEVANGSTVTLTPVFAVRGLHFIRLTR
jgi:hypothetical protein